MDKKVYFECQRCKEEFQCDDCARGIYSCQIHHDWYHNTPICTRCIAVTNYDLHNLDAKQHL